jgi:poly(3-hydroxybutyrate) depolymerase
MRDVYPGFLQITGFMTMNLDRHVDAHKELYLNLVRGDGDSAQKHREFYDEYLAVMDLTAEFYLQTVKTVFIDHSLPKGEMMHRGKRVDPGAIRNVALFTVEGEKDDITGGGQTEAAQRLCTGIPAEKKVHYTQPAVGHYGVFNGSRFRSEIAPRISDFILSNNGQTGRTAPRKATAARVVADLAGEVVSMAARIVSNGKAKEGEPVSTGAEGGIFLAAPQGTPDDLTLISGVGPKLAQVLNEQGVWHFWQIARLSDAEAEALDEKLGTFRGRMSRDGWIAQAGALAKPGV